MRRSTTIPLVTGQALTGTLTEIGTAGNARIRVMNADFITVLVDYTRGGLSATGAPIFKLEFNNTADTGQDPATITTGWYGVPVLDSSTFASGNMEQFAASATAQPTAAGPYRVAFGPFSGASGSFARVLLADVDGAVPGTVTVGYFEAVGGP